MKDMTFFIISICSFFYAHLTENPFYKLCSCMVYDDYAANQAQQSGVSSVQCRENPCAFNSASTSSNAICQLHSQAICPAKLTSTSLESVVSVFDFVSRRYKNRYRPPLNYLRESKNRRCCVHCDSRTGFHQR